MHTWCSDSAFRKVVDDLLSAIDDSVKNESEIGVSLIPESILSAAQLVKFAKEGAFV